MTNRGRARTVIGVVACAAILSACQGVTDYAHSTPVAQRRAAAARDIDTVGRSLSALGPELGRSTHDYCEESQDNFKVNTTWRYQCRRSSSVLIDPEAPTLARAVSELEVALREAGCEALTWAPTADDPTGRTVRSYTVNCPAVSVQVRGFIDPADANQLEYLRYPDEITVVDSPFSDETVSRFADASPLGWRITFTSGYATEPR
ncbi:MAG: hypothetical protein ACK5LS_01210 [Propioniciclava sp.]